ncbi:AEC family transporter [Granulosicoccaceae sp. 1_MG-2023]|nr:AEC family transporter [Granulosicoccaceae sp. 1_MG-2023]
MFIDILLITAPVFLLLLVGVLAVRVRAFMPEMIPGAGRLVMNLLMPALIFRVLSGADTETVLELHLLLVYALGSLSCFVLIFLLSRYVLGSGLTQSGLHGLGSATSNSAFFGLALLLQINESVALVTFSLALIVENLLIIPLGLALAESGSVGDEAASFVHRFMKIIRRVLLNPLIIAIFTGLMFSLFELPVPELADKVLAMLAGAAAPLALLTIGATLGSMRPGWPDRVFLLVGGGKLLLHPVMVWSMVLLLPAFDPALQKAAVLMAAMPMFTLYAIISAGYGHGERGSVVLLFTTLSSFVSINAVLWLLGPF